MDKEQLVEFLENNLELECKTTYDHMGNPGGAEIILSITVNGKKKTITSDYLDMNN